MSIEVWTRRFCNNFTCRGGYDEHTKKNCVMCKGKGYIEEWEFLDVLLKKAIKFTD
jgi:DnaJ-class molecular chaperone